MFFGILGHMRQNVVAYIALFIALGGTSAYAANEWTGTNIVDESLTGADVKGADATSSVAGTNGSLTGADIAGQPASAPVGQPFINGSLTTWDIRDNSLSGRDVKDGSLKDEDVGKFSLVRFEATIGSLAAHGCRTDAITGIPVKADHLLLTADNNDATANYMYSIRFDSPNPLGLQNIAWL